jgi:hypothetical protein
MNCPEQPAPKASGRLFGPALAAGLRTYAFTDCCHHWLASTLGRQQFIGAN